MHANSLNMIAAASLVFLSGCAGTAESPNAGPGAQDADSAVAARIFYDVCVETLPTHDGAAAALANYPFTRHSTFGTYYHNVQNLSVKIVGGQCSMVFATSSNPTQFIVAFGRSLDAIAQANGKTNVDVSLGGGPQPDGKFYANARTAATQ